MEDRETWSRRSLRRQEKRFPEMSRKWRIEKHGVGEA